VEDIVIVVTNRIPVAKAHEADFEDRFRKRAHLVDQAARRERVGSLSREGELAPREPSG
jgi:heme-degrading monooxygenase HmoA